MLGIIVCQLQPSKSPFEIIKEKFLVYLFLCCFTIFLTSSEQNVQTVTTPQRQKALV